MMSFLHLNSDFWSKWNARLHTTARPGEVSVQHLKNLRRRGGGAARECLQRLEWEQKRRDNRQRKEEIPNTWKQPDRESKIMAEKKRMNTARGGFPVSEKLKAFVASPKINSLHSSAGLCRFKWKSFWGTENLPLLCSQELELRAQGSRLSASVGL